jgi:hypothetical protein
MAKLTLDELRRAIAERQANSIINKTKKAIKNIPNTSTRFQLEVELAARQAASREVAKLKKKYREKKRGFLNTIWYGDPEGRRK